MTEVIYLKVSEKTEAAKKAGRRVSVSGMLKFLGVSRSGCVSDASFPTNSNPARSISDSFILQC